MVGLSDPSSLPLFQYYDPATDSVQEIAYSDGFQPRRIDSYVLDPADWHPKNRTYKTSPSSPFGFGPPHQVKSRAAILAYGLDDEDPCRVCGHRGTSCFGDSCVRSFRRGTERVAREGKLRIEATGVQEGVSMGYGVFSGARICGEDIMGEYLGQLCPLDGARRREQDYSYAFELEGVAVVDAREYGSITRFINHHCKPNLDVEFITYGRRRCIAFAANRDIDPGEQLFIHYGDDYFRRSRPCLCDVVPYPHVPSKGSEPPRMGIQKARALLKEGIEYLFVFSSDQCPEDDSKSVVVQLTWRDQEQ